MDLHEDFMRNVRTITSEHTYKQLTHTIFNQPEIFSSQTNTRIVDTCVDTYFIPIGSGIF